MKKTYMLFFVLFLVYNVSAQKNYKPAYLIKDGKIVEGEIALPSIGIQKNICYFKDENNQLIEYSPKEITGFRFVNGRNFESTTIKDTLLFAEKIVEGKISLYAVYLDENKSFWIKKEDESLIELKNTRIEIRNEERTVVGIRDKKEYTGVLKSLMWETKDLNETIDRSKLNEKNLISLINKYHEIVCPDDMCQVYKKKFELNVFVGPELRVNRSNLTFDFTKNFTNTFSKRTFTNSNALSIGFNIITSGNNDYLKTLMPGLGVFYNANTYYSPRKPDEGETAEELDLFEIKTKSVNLPLSLTYIVSPNKAFTPCFGAGMVYEIFLQNNFAEYLGPMVTDRVKETHTANGKINFFANAGFRYALNKHWVLDSRISYQQGGGIVSSLANSWDSKIQRISFNVSIQYKLKSKTR